MTVEEAMNAGWPEGFTPSREWGSKTHPTIALWARSKQMGKYAAFVNVARVSNNFANRELFFDRAQIILIDDGTLHVVTVGDDADFITTTNVERFDTVEEMVNWVRMALKLLSPT